MKFWDCLTVWQQRLTTVAALAVMTGAFFVWAPTPFHMDVEAAEYQQQQQSAQGCAEVYRLEAQIAEAEMQLLNPAVPDWYKAELNRKLPVWRETLRRLRAEYKCVEYAR